MPQFCRTAFILMMGILVSCSSGENSGLNPEDPSRNVSAPSICTPLNPHRGDEITCRGGDRTCGIFFGHQLVTPTYNPDGTFVARVPGALPSGNTVIAMVCGQDPRQTLGSFNVTDLTPGSGGSGGSGGSAVGGGGSGGAGGSGGSGGSSFSSCRTDRDCSGGATCQANRCISAPPECTNDSQCTRDPLRNMCSGNRCVGCVSNLDCSAGMICGSGNTCRGCTGNTDCIGGGVCPTATGTATRLCTTCSSTVSCGEGYNCRSGACFENISVTRPVTQVSFARNSSPSTSTFTFDILKIVADNVPGYMYFPVPGMPVSGVTSCPEVFLNSTGEAPLTSQPAGQVCEERLANCLNFQASDYPGLIVCRVDVGQTLYKKMVMANERVVRVYRDASGISQALQTEPLTSTSPLTITRLIIEMDSTRPQYSVTGDYTGATARARLSGCTTIPSGDTSDFNATTGIGSLRVTCLFQAHSGLTVTFQGIGRTESRRLSIDCNFQDGDVTLQRGSFYTNNADRMAAACSLDGPSSTCGEGFIDLTGSVTRTCTMTHADGTTSSKKVPWGLTPLQMRQTGVGCMAQTSATVTDISSLPSGMILESTPSDGKKFSWTTRLGRTAVCYNYLFTVNGGDVSSVAPSLSIPLNYAPIFEVSPAASGDRDWRFDFTATDAVHDIWDDYCTPNFRLGQCDVNTDDSDVYYCRQFPVRAASQLNQAGNLCEHNSDHSGFAACKNYRLNRLLIRFIVQNVRDIDVYCCEYGEGRSARGDTPTADHSCEEVRGNRGTLRHLPTIHVSDSLQTRQDFVLPDALRPTLYGEAVKCSFFATTFSGEVRAPNMTNPYTFERPSGACDGRDESGDGDEDDTDLYLGTFRVDSITPPYP